MRMAAATLAEGTAAEIVAAVTRVVVTAAGEMAVEAAAETEPGASLIEDVVY